MFIWSFHVTSKDYKSFNTFKYVLKYILKNLKKKSNIFFDSNKYILIFYFQMRTTVSYIEREGCDGVFWIQMLKKIKQKFHYDVVRIITRNNTHLIYQRNNELVLSFSFIYLFFLYFVFDIFIYYIFQFFFNRLSNALENLNYLVVVVMVGGCGHCDGEVTCGEKKKMKFKIK